MMRTAVSAIMTGAVNSWRCFPQPVSSPFTSAPATHEQAERLADAVRARLLTPGGIMATEYESGEQWDKPNGWAPLQWMAIRGI